MNSKTLLTIVCVGLATFDANSRNKSIYGMKKQPINRPEELVGPIRDDEQFLKDISMIESSGGTNLEHKTIKSGIHAGDTAVGELGLMPNTVRELAKRLRDRDFRLQLGAEFKGDPEIEQYADPKIDQKTLQYAMETSPEMMQRVGRYMERLVNTRFKEPDKMAYAWNQGHNIDPSKITPEKLEKSDYVKKRRNFEKLRQQIAQNRLVIP